MEWCKYGVSRLRVYDEGRASALWSSLAEPHPADRSRMRPADVDLLESLDIWLRMLPADAPYAKSRMQWSARLA